MILNSQTTNNPAQRDLQSLSTYILDLDGVIWRGAEPIEGAAESVRRLQAAGKRCLYCTNNSKKTQKQFAAKLREMGINCRDEDVISSSVSTAMYLAAQFTGPFLAYVIGEEGIITALQKIGARVVPEMEINGDTEVDCVVVGIDRFFNYDKLRIAQRLIHNGALFIATNCDKTFPTEHGIVPGAGAIVASVEAASGVAPVVIGKPRPVMVQLTLNRLGITPGETAMVGDRLDTDIACARRSGVTAIFVATGVTPMDQAQRAKGELRADAFFEDLPALCRAVLDEPATGDGIITGVTEEAVAEEASVAEPAVSEPLIATPSDAAITEPISVAEPAVSQPLITAPSGAAIAEDVSVAEPAAPGGFLFDDITESQEAQPAPLGDLPTLSTPEDQILADTDSSASDTGIAVGDVQPVVSEPTASAAATSEATVNEDDFDWGDDWFAEHLNQPAAPEGQAVADSDAPAEEKSKPDKDSFAWKLE